MRRVLLGLKGLPFPEGTATGKVLRASARVGAEMKQLVQGSLVGGFIVLVQTGFGIITDHLPLWFKSKTTLFGISIGFNPALLGAGYIIGPVVGLAMFTGTILGWVLGVPILSWIYGLPTGTSGIEDLVMNIWSNHIRFIGVGTMIVGGVWTLLTLLKPIVVSFRIALRAMRSQQMNAIAQRTEKDLPLKVVIISILLLLSLSFFFLLHSLSSSGLGLNKGMMLSIGFISIACILVFGFMSSLVVGYVVGLIGSTNTPVSGLFIINVLLLSLILLPLLATQTHLSTHFAHQASIAFIILLLAIIGSVISITCENIQDLKAGRMVGATPWKQQLMMLLGVVVSAFAISPVLNLLFQAYGIGGVFPHPGMDPGQMLPAPQAGLIAALIQGVVGHSLPWTMMITGGIIGVLAILGDEFLKTKNYRLPVLAVGIGIYLPPEIITPTLIGGLIHYFAIHKLKSRTQSLHAYRTDENYCRKKESAVLLACGLVAGSSLMGVILAIPFVLKGSSDALRLVSDNFVPFANLIGVVVLISLCAWLYRATCQLKK